MRATILSRFFPTPKFLDVPASGLDLSSNSIKFLGLEKKGGTLSVKHYGEEKLPPETIIRGEIKDEKGLTLVLQKLKQAHRLDYGIVSLPEEKSYIFNISIPYVSPKEIRSALELHLEENIPLPLENIVFDFDVVRYEEESDELVINVSALPLNIVKSYTEIFEKAGIVPVVIDSEAVAIARAVIPRGALGTFLIVDFGEERTSLSVYQGGFIRFNSILDFGARDITQAIMKDFNLDFNEAEKLKIEKGIEHKKNTTDIFSSAAPSLSVLKDEVTKYQLLWDEREEEKKDDAKKIEKIYFSGGGAGLLGFPEFLSTYITAPFEIANPWMNVFNLNEKIPSIQKKDALRYVTAIGLALHSVYHHE
jgi:type IV pilus assembly protein PilM